MQITERVLAILQLARRYKILNRRIINEELFPDDADGSITRDVLRKMVNAGMVQRVSKTNEHVVQTAPIYVPTDAGCCTLAAKTGQMAWLLDCQPNIRSPQNFPHMLSVTRLTRTIDKSVALQDHVAIPQLFFEHDFVSNDPDPAKRYKLYTVVGKNTRGGNIICNADFASLVRVGNYERAYYWELETGSDGSPRRVIQKKTPGYIGLADEDKYHAHFPEAQDMKCIAICPNAGWREAMRRAVLELTDRRGRNLWLFVDRDSITVESFLHAPIFYTAEDGPKPFVKPAPGATPPEGPVPGVKAGADSVILSTVPIPS